MSLRAKLTNIYLNINIVLSKGTVSVVYVFIKDKYVRLILSNVYKTFKGL